MVNIRIDKLTVKSNTKIEVKFTAALDSRVGIENVTIVGSTSGIDSLTVISTTVSGNLFTINVRPMVPRESYKLTLASTTTQSVVGQKGESFIEDGRTNVVYFIGLREEDEVSDIIIEDLPPIYEKEGGLIVDIIDSSGKQITTASNAAGKVKSANYVSIEVVDESIIRGSGPFDRFANEGVYQLLRASSTETGTGTASSLSFDKFPSDPVSLQQITVTDEVVSNSANDSNSFEGLLITVAKSPVIKVTSLTLKRGSSTFTYDISQFRYGLLDSKYDTTNSYPALDINFNQIRLSSSAVGPLFPLPEGNDQITITYLHKRLGRDVDPDSVEVVSIVDKTRENVPSVATTFFLGKAPIVDSAGVTITITGGVTWLDPSTNFDTSTNHPAFVNEIRYNQASLPKSPGEFAIKYDTGQVFVFGADGSGVDGTTNVPPVATYKFLKTFQEGLDYNFFADLDEVASVPGRDLRGNDGKINFNYQDTFANGTDFKLKSNIEVLGERVENRLIDNIGLITKNSPVNEVFRIYNETTGEIYSTSRISKNEIFFSATNPPRIISVSRETADFDRALQSQIVVTDTLSISGKSFSAFRVKLSNIKISAATGDYIGASFNSSLVFSDSDVFVEEFYYDPEDTLNENLARLQEVGNYMVDYEFGLAYVAVNSGASTDIGDATYRYGTIRARNNNITKVDDIYRSASVNLTNTKTFEVGDIGVRTVKINDLEHVGEREISDTPILVVSSTSGETITVSKDILRLRAIFQVTDLQTTSDPIDFSPGAVVSSSTPTTITLDSSGVPISDDYGGAGLVVKIAGSRKYIDAERLSALDLAGLAELKSGNSVIDNTTGVNYFNQGSDGYIDATTNRVYLPSTTDAVGGELTTASYNAQLRGGAAVLVDYTPGDIFIDYSYSKDELIIDYEYGDNVLDWSVSSALSEGEEYFVTYRYGALRNALLDNFGILTSIDELSTIPDELDRETYRNAVSGSLQTFPKGPTIESIKLLVEALTQIPPNITESVFLEWILGRDFLHLLPMELGAGDQNVLPSYSTGKFGNGLLLDTENQTATLPANSNLRFNEGSWHSFITPSWNGIDNDADLTFNILFEGKNMPEKVYIGADNANPEEIPFILDKTDPSVLGKPSFLHQKVGYFIWFDSNSNRWRLRARAPVTESRVFSGSVTTSGEFYDVRIASTADGYEGYDGYEVNEINDILRSSDETVQFSFVVDSYDSMNMTFDSYDSYDGYTALAGFDGFDFSSDNIHYIFDTGVKANQCRMSLYKDGKGFLRFKVYDENKRVKMLSKNIQDWEKTDTHHIGVSWRFATTQMRDEMHLFVDGYEATNTYRFRGYLDAPTSGANYMDDAIETLVASAAAPTIGGSDLSTILGSSIVTSLGSDFVSEGVTVGSRFLIRDDTDDGAVTESSPFVYVRTVTSATELDLEIGPPGSAVPFSAASTLSNINFSVNPLTLQTVSDPQIEEVRVFTVDSYGTETELYSPETLTLDYEFSEDGYQDFVEVYNGVSIGDSLELRTYGLIIARCKQLVYIWPDLRTNILMSIMPSPTSIAKINITQILVKRVEIAIGAFAVVATTVGSHIIPVLVSNLDFCQPSNTTTGRTLSVTASGDNIDFNGLNQVLIFGNTTDGYNSELITFTTGATKDTSRYFTSITDIVASFTPIDITKSIGAVEIRERLPINIAENGGIPAEIRLSVQEQAGFDGYTTIGTGNFTDGYSRFGAEDIGKFISITSPSSIANTYKINNVLLDPSGSVKDSNTVVLNTTWADAYTDVEWKMLSTSYADSGFANGLITLEASGTAGQPFLLRKCWYEVDFPIYLTVPWEQIPNTLYIGSDMNSENQADAVIDEMIILDEMLNDTGRGEPAPSSGRSMTTAAQVVREQKKNSQTLGLFHFNDDVENSADFFSTFEKTFRQSANSVNTLFGQSGIFTEKKRYQVDNASIFKNNEGTIEFWISPILDTYNDPTNRYYIDLSPDQIVEATAISALVVPLPSRARSISSITIEGSNTNYFIGGSLSDDGLTATLGRALPSSVRTVTVIFVPITSKGDRFSVLKNELGQLVLSVRASDVDYQITSPIFWKKNTWHRVFIGWDLNNLDNQDRLIMMVDGTEGGSIRYGTGLIYGTGVVYGQPTVWGSAQVGTTASRNILSDINMLDQFNTVNIGADFTGQFPALARMDNIRFSSALRSITLLGGEGPGKTLGKDLLFTSNTNTAQPVVTDALTRLLLDFNTTQKEVDFLATVRDDATGIFDFFVEIIDTFDLLETDLKKDLITQLINRIKPAHTRAFVSFIK